MKISRLFQTLSLAASLAATTAFAQSTPIPPVAIGEPLPGLTAQELAYFYEGKAMYEKDFTPQEGLGPLHNGPACTTCHFGGGTGGSEHGTANNVHHITVQHDGQTYLAFELGGAVRQTKSITGTPGANPDCIVSGETDPTSPGSQISVRHTPPVFGFGLLDAVPDAAILKNMGPKPSKKPGVIGAANWGVELEGLVDLLAFKLDATRRTQPVGAPRVGRFGWKAPTATLFQFTTEPFNIELGVSTPFFPRENMPDGSIIPEACRLPGHQPNDINSQQSLRLFYFQAFLAPPPRGPITPDVVRGEALFKQIGCEDCHVQGFTTVPNYHVPWPDGSSHRVAALSGKSFNPWSDLLIHDMGEALADHRPQGKASGRFWRTTPLWGTRFKTNYLHDGRATTVHEATLAHGGEATASTQAYNALSPQDKARVIQFIQSL